MGYREIALDYYRGGNPNLLLQLLGNTAGNTNGNWIDTSMYGLNATQLDVAKQATLTTDQFGTGNYGYVFGQFDIMTIPDNDVFEIDPNSNYQPFTVTMKVKWTSTQATCNLISKFNGTEYEWYIILYQGQLRFVVYSGGSNTVYIRKAANFTPTLNEIYSFKFVYEGDRVASNLKIYVNDIDIGGMPNSIGTFQRINNTTSPIFIGIKTYVAPIGALTDIEIWKGVV